MTAEQGVRGRERGRSASLTLRTGHATAKEWGAALEARRGKIYFFRCFNIRFVMFCVVWEICVLSLSL